MNRNSLVKHASGKYDNTIQTPCLSSRRNVSEPVCSCTPLSPPPAPIIKLRRRFRNKIRCYEIKFAIEMLRYLMILLSNNEIIYLIYSKI